MTESSGRPNDAVDLSTGSACGLRQPLEEAPRESDHFARATVDALSAHLAILDEAGTIIATNRAWNQFAEANSDESHRLGEGMNYLAVCDAATGPNSEGAAEFAAGVRAVMQGAREEFTLEYPCHSPEEKRWFIGRVTRFAGEGTPRLVVAHENITARRQAEEALQKAFDDIRTLRGILPICANCKKIRNDKGYWEQVEEYVGAHTEAEFSHSMCPECMRELYPTYMEHATEDNP